MKIRLLQQMSGSRGDGSTWPPVGSVIDVGPEEARDLTRTSGSTLPIAEYVEETADAPDKKTEQRNERAPKAPPAASKTPAGSTPAGSSKAATSNAAPSKEPTGAGTAGSKGTGK